MTETTESTTILAIVGERSGAPVRRRAIELARESGAGLILWDADAGKRLLEDPLPNQWSAHGEEEQFGERLTVSDLEAAGRAPLARQVAEAEAAGVRAWGWLPADQKAETVRDYATRHGAEIVVVSAEDDMSTDLDGGGIRVEVVPATG